MKKLYIIYLIFLIVLSSFASAIINETDPHWKAYYRMQDNLSSEIVILGNMTWAAGEGVFEASCKSGGCYDFNGTSRTLTPTDDSIWNRAVNESITLSAWIYPHDNTDVGIMEVSRTDNGFFINSVGQIAVRTYSGDSHIVTCTNTTIPINEWTFVLGTWTDGVVEIYVNKSRCNTGTSPHQANPNAAAGIGESYDGTAFRLFDGLIDEAAFLNRSVTQTEVTQWWNDGAGYFPFAPEAAPIGTPTKPTIELPSPANDAVVNVNQTLNVSHDTPNNDVRYYLYFGTSLTLDEGDLIYNNVTRNASEYSAWTTGADSGDDVYYWKARVQNTSNGAFSTNTTQREFQVDTVTPTITRLPNNNWQTNNLTILSPYIINLTLNISFFDDYLHETLINITNSSGGSVYNHTNISITQTTDNISKVIDISGWQIGNYTLELVAVDSHTLSSIEDYSIFQGIDYIRFKTEEGNVIKIISDSLPLTKSTTKLKDRYDFKFNYLFQKDTYKFRIESYNEIKYIQNSNFKAHFVIMGDNGRGNWIDFENPNLNKKDYVITKLDDYTYQVEVYAPTIKSFTFSSLGGLNIVEQHHKIQIASVIDVWVYDEENYPTKINATVTSGVQSVSSSNLTAATLENITKDITSLTLSSDGFGTEEKTISITDKYNNFSFNMTGVSAAKLHFYDESTNTLITGETFSIYLETTGFSQSYSTSSNPYSITSLINGLYKLKASSTNYPERQYLDLNISNVTTTVLDIFLVNSTLGSEIAFNTLDSNSENIEDVNVDFYRIINGTLTNVAKEQTDYGGTCRLYLDTNNEYTINFSKTNYLTKTINLEPATADSPYTIYLDDETAIIPPLAVAYTIRKIFIDGITFNLTYTNTTKIVHFDWYDENSYVDNMCMKVYDTNRSFYSNCSALNTGEMNHIIITGNRTYTAKAWANKDNRDYTLKIININLLEVITKLGKDVVIISWIVFLTLAFIGLAKPYVSLFLSVFGLIGMYLIGMLPIGFGTIMGIISVAVIISMGIRRSRSQ